MEYNKRLADTELIINTDGTVYHLGLLPKHVAPLIITVGDPARVAQVSQRFDEVTHQVDRREFRTHVGRFAERPIMCISTGIGTDNVDIVFNELDALVNVDFATKQVKTDLTPLTFLRLGTSGTFQPEIAVDTLLASSAAIGIDGLGPFYNFETQAVLREFQQEFGNFAAAAYYGNASVDLLAAWNAQDIDSGCTLTCAGFYGPQRRQIRLPFSGPSLEDLAEFRNGWLTNFEMETAGIYGLANLLGHRALSVSAILANRATGQFSNQPAQVIDKVIDTAFLIIKQDPKLWWQTA